jgi:hypothetical protein
MYRSLAFSQVGSPLCPSQGGSSALTMTLPRHDCRVALLQKVSHRIAQAARGLALEFLLAASSAMAPTIASTMLGERSS